MLPIILNIKDKRAIVFGGGEVSERRTMKLLSSGAQVRVVSREFTEKLKHIESEKLELIRSEVKEDIVTDHLKDIDLVLIATDDSVLNDRIENEIRKLGLLINRCDKVSDFVMPAVVDMGGISIAISTGGRSPAIAKAIKSRIKKLITKEDVLLIELEEFLKEGLKKKVKDQRQRKIVLREIMVKPEIIECLKDDNIDKAKRLVTEYLED